MIICIRAHETVVEGKRNRFKKKESYFAAVAFAAVTAAGGIETCLPP